MQQRSEKTAEPSMEAILASIRKIIAEDPATPAPGNAAGAPPDALLKPLAPSPLAAARALNEPPKEAPRAAVPPVAPVMPTPAMPSSRLSDMMRELAPSAVPVGASPATPSAPSFHDDLADLVEGDEPAAPPMPPLVSRGPATRIEPDAPKLETQPLPQMPEASAAAPAPSRHADLGAFIPSTAEPIGMTAPRPKPLSVGADLRRGPIAEAPAAPALDFGTAMPLTARRIAEPRFETPREVESEPLPEPEFKAETSAPVETAPTATSVPPSEVEAAAASDADPMAAAQSALGALALGLAAPSPPVEMTVVPSPRNEASTLETSLPAEAGRKSLDDTIVDMLRPMIRDWLDDNLPEMVKKALTEELIERARSGR